MTDLANVPAQTTVALPTPNRQYYPFDFDALIHDTMPTSVSSSTIHHRGFDEWYRQMSLSLSCYSKSSLKKSIRRCRGSLQKPTLVALSEYRKLFLHNRRRMRKYYLKGNTIMVQMMVDYSYEMLYTINELLAHYTQNIDDTVVAFEHRDT